MKTKNRYFLLLTAIVLNAMVLTGCDEVINADTKPAPAATDFIITGLNAYTENESFEIEIKSLDGKTDGIITIYYTGKAPTVYAKTQTKPTKAGEYNVTFDVAETDEFKAAFGFFAGVLTITAHDDTDLRAEPKTADFSISGAGTYEIDQAYTIKITPLTGKTGGDITIYYEGRGSTVYPKSETGPTEIGEYTITFDVTEKDNFKAASGLSAGNLTITPLITGAGTLNNPFRVRTADDLRKVASETNTGGWTRTVFYLQVNDIDLEEYFETNTTWAPICPGTAVNFRFTGTYDGGNKKITGLRISSGSNNQGLFGYIGRTGMIRNVNLVDVIFQITDMAGNAGALAGYHEGVIDNCTVSDSSITGSGDNVGGIAGYCDGLICNSSVTDITVKGRKNIGGIAGENEYSTAINSTGTIRNCNVTDTNIESSQSHSGGIAGTSWGYASQITDCTVSGLTVKGGSNAGGITGYNHGYCITRLCSVTNIAIDGENKIGGITGENMSYAILNTNSVKDAVIKGNKDLGGIAGRNGALIHKCSAINIDIDGKGNIGGIAGNNFHFTSELSNCYATGSIKANGTNAAAGGLVGLTETPLSFVRWCYTTVNIDGIQSGGISGAPQHRVEHSVALNEYIVGTEGANRISYDGREIDMTNNYANSDMLVNGEKLSSTGPYDPNGKDVESNNFHNETWWKTGSGLNWDFSTVWIWDGTIRLPVLR